METSTTKSLERDTFSLFAVFQNLIHLNSSPIKTEVNSNNKDLQEVKEKISVALKCLEQVSATLAHVRGQEGALVVSEMTSQTLTALFPLISHIQHNDR